MTNKPYKVEFTLPTYEGKWIPLSGQNEDGFQKLEQAEKQCQKMGPVYFTSGDHVCYWQQRIIDQAGNVIAMFNEFRAND